MNIRTLLCMALALPAAAAHSAPLLADHASLDQAIERFTGSTVGMPGGAITPIDRRLRLNACADVKLSWRSPRRDTLVVECPTGAGWRLFVSVATTAPAPAPVAAAVPAVAAPAPLAVAKGDIVTVEIRGNGFAISQNGQAMEPGPVGGWIKIKMPGKGDMLTAQVVRHGLVALPAS